MNTAVRKNIERRIVLMFFLIWGFTFFNRLSINFAMPLIQETLGITDSHTGTIVFVSTVAMAISSLIVGSVSDKQRKRKKFLFPAVLIVGIASATSILATNYTSFLIIRTIMGFGLGPILGMVFSITEVESSENKFGANTGLIMAGDAVLASIIGPLLITQLTKFMSWQASLSISSLPTIILAFVMLKVVPEVQLSSPAEAADKPKASILSVFKYPNVTVCIFLIIFTLGAYFIVATYASLYLTEVMGYSMDTTGLVMSLMGVIYIFYAVLIPRSTDKFGRKPVVTIIILLCATAPLLMFLFPNSMIAMVGYVAFGGLAGSIHVFFNTVIPLESLPDNLKTTGSSVIYAFGEILGSATMPLIGGIISDKFSYGAAMLMAAILFIISFFLCFLLKETNKNVSK